MTVTVRPYTKFASALLAAGVVATASPALVEVAERAAPAVSSAAVQPASVVTDLLYNIGDAVYGATWVIGNPVYAALSLPFNAVYTLATSLKDPALIGSVLSYITQIYLNPDSAVGGYAYGVKSALLDITTTLPNPLGTWTTGTVNTLSGVFASLFNALPDGTAGGDVFEDIGFDSTLGRALWSVREALVVPVAIIADVITWLGYVPAELEATLESAIREPSEIPGLLSNLVRSVLDPSNGVLGWVVQDLFRPFYYLPGPIGDTLANSYFGWANQLFTAFANGMDNLLDALLPTPVTPMPFAKAAAAGGALATASTVPTDGVEAFTLDVPKDAAEDEVAKVDVAETDPAADPAQAVVTPEKVSDAEVEPTVVADDGVGAKDVEVAKGAETPAVVETPKGAAEDVVTAKEAKETKDSTDSGVSAGGGATVKESPKATPSTTAGSGETKADSDSGTGHPAADKPESSPKAAEAGDSKSGDSAAAA